MFQMIVVNPQRVVFEGEADRVFLQGDEGEFEILDYHAPVLSLLRKGKLVIDEKKQIKIRGGVARFDHNTLVVLAESAK